MTNSLKIIFHLDLDCFFASAEQTNNQSLKGKPILIAHHSEKSIATAVSIEAKKLGHVVGMPIFKQRQINPNFIIVPVNYLLYQQLSEKLFQLLSRYSKLLEIGSIDECWLDVTKYLKQHQLDPISFAKIIQNQIERELDLPISIGISENKFLAKMATDMNKPRGITTLFKNEIEQKLWPLEIKKMTFVGKKTTIKLNNYNIQTINDIANLKTNLKLYDQIKKEIGITLDQYINFAWGNDTNLINPKYQELKSIQNEYTSYSYLTTYDEIISELYQLTKFVSIRAKDKLVIGKVVRIILKSALTKQKRSIQVTLNDYTNDFNIIFSQVEKLLNQVWNYEPIKLVGVSLANLISIYDLQKQYKINDIFNNNKDERFELQSLIQKLNLKYREPKIMTLEMYQNSPQHHNKRSFELNNDELENGQKKI